ncbi:MAG: glycine cleavage system protein H [Flavobacteriales bacterium]|nr:glycine cleavage system protein H [Flavobacteriales bacterium]|tara:strand:+ start:1140 stop:1520 length:381 start_codon:yes stop_codon:yes gene_type:complete
MEIPNNLKYTKDHEWILINDDEIVCGITDFAQRELGDIVYVDIDTVGDSVERESIFGTIEAVKTVSDLFMPISGTIIEQNDELNNNPQLINESPYEKGWIVKIKNSNIAELDKLLSAEEYKKEIGL